MGDFASVIPPAFKGKKRRRITAAAEAEQLGKKKGGGGAAEDEKRASSERERKRRRGALGRGSQILSGSLGVTEQANIGRKRLTGG